MAANDIYGLVICGGKSTRMGREKYLLDYYGLPQYQHVYQLLEPFCSKVFISCNPIQAPHIDPAFPVITDHISYQESGPVAGLLSAFNTYPDKSWLVTGCDYPLITAAEIGTLTGCFTQGLDTTAFYNRTTGYYEPLLAVYASGCYSRLEAHFRQQQYSLQQFLKEEKAMRCYPQEDDLLKSIDTPEAYEQARQLIRNGYS